MLHFLPACSTITELQIESLGANWERLLLYDAIVPELVVLHRLRAVTFVDCEFDAGFFEALNSTGPQSSGHVWPDLQSIMLHKPCGDDVFNMSGGFLHFVYARTAAADEIEAFRADFSVTVTGVELMPLWFRRALTSHFVSGNARFTDAEGNEYESEPENTGMDDDSTEASFTDSEDEASSSDVSLSSEDNVCGRSALLLAGDELDDDGQHDGGDVECEADKEYEDVGTDAPDWETSSNMSIPTTTPKHGV